MKRINKVNSLIKSEIALILRKNVGDERVGFVSITEVKVSNDLKHAWIYYSALGNDKEKTKTGKGLNSAKGYIRAQLCKTLNLKTIPDLHFKPDNSLERGSDIINKL